MRPPVAYTVRTGASDSAFRVQLLRNITIAAQQHERQKVRLHRAAALRGPLQAIQSGMSAAHLTVSSKDGKQTWSKVSGRRVERETERGTCQGPHARGVSFLPTRLEIFGGGYQGGGDSTASSPSSESSEAVRSRTSIVGESLWRQSGPSGVADGAEDDRYWARTGIDRIGGRDGL